MTIRSQNGVYPAATLLAGLALASLLGCSPPAPPEPAASEPASSAAVLTQAPTLVPVAGIQDLMKWQLTPAAEALWASVSTTVTAAGEEEIAPSTPEDWQEVHAHALTVIEVSNLLLMDGRRVIRAGIEHLDDHGTPGNLTAEEAEAAIAANREVYVGYATALRSIGQDFALAIDARNTQGMLDAGDALEKNCEGCHLKFWYPGQVIPPFPGEAPEEPAPVEAESSH